MGKVKSNDPGAVTTVEPAMGENASNVTSISAAGRANRKTPTVESMGDKTASVVAASLIVFGRDEAGKAHASTFVAAEAELAARAAGLMGYRVLPITSDEHRAAASGLAVGRVFASGRGFVPFAKEAAYIALVALGGSFLPPAPVEPELEKALVATGKPQRWEDIVVGSLVLASAGPDEGWFEAVVSEARGDSIFRVEMARVARTRCLRSARRRHGTAS